MYSSNSFFLICLIITLLASFISAQIETFGKIQNKGLRFQDPNTGYTYRLVSYNATPPIAYSSHKSIIRVSRYKLDEQGRIPYGGSEDIQTLKFHATLVDFDLHCLSSHCYLVAVTARNKKNLELYAWKRTQFDLLARRDSFARPHAVKLFPIRSNFYIAVAQDQLHLAITRHEPEDEEQTRFIGCAIFQFSKGLEHDMKYHQFIRLPFNPYYVEHLTSINTTFYAPNAKPQENHYLVFSIGPGWNEQNSVNAHSFVWSALNGYFWPYRFPRGVIVSPRVGSTQLNIRFPTSEIVSNVTTNQPSYQVQLVESCFNQLQRLLNDREVRARDLIESTHSLWRSNQHERSHNQLTNISAQVIVHGNVIVKGSLVESPQITLIGRRGPPEKVYALVDTHSPAIVENKLKQASYKLSHIQDKLARAVTNDRLENTLNYINSPVRFFAPVSADKVVFGSIANSNVKLNGIPFKQLEHELVNLRDPQEIISKVIFRGNVVADFLEIHGKINGNYFLKDALDIGSKQIQVIETISSPQSFEFNSIESREVVLSHNSTINGIRLDEFITRDSRTQSIYGRSSFRHISMARLLLANQNVPLNGFNISNIATKAVYLRGQKNPQYMNGQHVTFSRPISVNNLIINNMVNRNINISSLIHDSVKFNDIGTQQISGHKHFMQGLRVSHLTTDGSINGVKINQIFNLNPTPPVPDYYRYANMTFDPNAQVTGNIVCNSTVTVLGNLNTGLVNDVNINVRAIRRMQYNSTGTSNLYPMQKVSGTKIFLKPLRVVNHIRLLNNNTAPYPHINGFDLRSISEGILRQVQNPSVIYVENLEIDGNINLPTSYQFPTRTTLGNFKDCPLDLIKSRLIVGGNVNQVIDVPIRINSLRAKSINLDTYALGGLDFPNDFVLRHKDGSSYNYQGRNEPVEYIHGIKHFDNLEIIPPLVIPMSGDPYARSAAQNIVFGSRATINNITYNDLQTFIDHERRRNSSGETVLQTMNVFGNIKAKRINGYYWPDDILLKSLVSNRLPSPSPYLHKRIYSPLIFSETSSLEVENQLVLRGPIQLVGRLNGVNLTEFSSRSATYGDKDLLTMGRPIQNKIFLGGLTVTGQVRSQGLIDGVDIEQMKNRVVTITPGGIKKHITGHKIFMSDIHFAAPISMIYLNELPLDHYLRMADQVFDGSGPIRLFGKKTITGSLKINKNLIVHGLINGVDFVDLKARAISLSPNNNDIRFNKTLTIEGDVYMDNLIIDEKNGTIDGIKLINLLPLEQTYKNELLIMGPTVSTQNSTNGYNLNIGGSLNDCMITCSLAQDQRYNKRPIIPYSPVQQDLPYPIQPPRISPQSWVSYPKRPVIYNGRNVTYMRTTPPYIQTNYQMDQPKQVFRTVVQPSGASIQNLAIRSPIAIQYERQVTERRNILPDKVPMLVEQLASLKKQIVSLNLVKSTPASDLVIGFIEAPSSDISKLISPDQASPPSDYNIALRSFLQLDQIDFPFSPTTYHLTVGVSTSSFGLNVTSVYSSFGGSEINQMSVLPVESPNSAMFLKISDQKALFLLISQDYTKSAEHSRLQCPKYWTSQSSANDDYSNHGLYNHLEQNRMLGGVHVYLFHALQNSSSLTSAYFDLYQTIDLPVIDSFESFSYKGSTYALAVSRFTEKVFLLLLRGYSGFQVVSYIEAPLVEYIKVLSTEDNRPIVIIYQSNGLHRLMESVII